MPPPTSTSALHHDQSSLEGILDFSSQPPLDPAHRDSARFRFDQIINHFESEGIRPGRDKYDRVKLVNGPRNGNPLRLWNYANEIIEPKARNASRFRRLTLIAGFLFLSFFLSFSPVNVRTNFLLPQKLLICSSQVQVNVLLILELQLWRGKLYIRLTRISNV